MLVTKRWWFLRWEIETPGARPPAKYMVAATKEKVNLNLSNVQSALILGCLEDFLGKVSWFQSSEPEVAPRLTSLRSAVKQIWRKSCLQNDAKTQRPWSWPRPSFWKAGTQAHVRIPNPTSEYRSYNGTRAFLWHIVIFLKERHSHLTRACIAGQKMNKDLS